MKKEAKWCFECTQHALFLFVIFEPEQSGSDYSFGCGCRLHKLKPNWFVLLWTLLKLKRGLSGHEELCLFKKTEKNEVYKLCPFLINIKVTGSSRIIRRLFYPEHKKFIWQI